MRGISGKTCDAIPWNSKMVFTFDVKKNIHNAGLCLLVFMLFHFSFHFTLRYFHALIEKNFFI